MKKCKYLFILMLIMSFLFISSSCDRLGVDPDLATENIPLMSIMKVNVPGGECGGSIERIEEDSYGRILFKGRPSNLVSRYYGEVFGYFICQKISGNCGYYYEDVCYIIKHSFDEISEEELFSLKKQNDWGNPLCEGKMSKIETGKNYYDELIKITDRQSVAVRNAFQDLTGEKWKNSFNSSSNSHNITPSCVDKEGRLLVYVLIYPSYADENQKNDQRTWAIILQPDNSFSQNACVAIEDPLNCSKILAEFKEKNGWVQ